MGVEVLTREIGNNELEISVKGLPSFSDLEKEVSKIVKKASWMDKYGYDWIIHFVGFLGMAIGLFMMTSHYMSAVILGSIGYSIGHSILSSKAGHMATHGGVCQSKSINKFFTWFFVEFIGAFSFKLGYDIHIRCHHPYTNIIGLGDSSTWRAPFLPRSIYLFIAPVLIPVITPMVSLAGLWGQWFVMMKYLISASAGICLFLWPLLQFGGYSVPGAVFLLFAARGISSISYLHINIFQHIGLPMFEQGSRPTRLFQMSSGVLNLNRHPYLDYTYGHSLISCHVEHHLFPRLSDNLCLMVKPTVRQYFKKHDLPYNQRPYMERLGYFYSNYERLMVKAPPISHFVGLQ